MKTTLPGDFGGVDESSYYLFSLFLTIVSFIADRSKYKYDYPLSEVHTTGFQKMASLTQY